MILVCQILRQCYFEAQTIRYAQLGVTSCAFIQRAYFLIVQDNYFSWVQMHALNQMYQVLFIVIFGSYHPNMSVLGSAGCLVTHHNYLTDSKSVLLRCMTVHCIPENHDSLGDGQFRCGEPSLGTNNGCEKSHRHIVFVIKMTQCMPNC